MRSLDIQHLPALIPPQEVIPNFENPEDRGSVLVMIGSILIGLTLVFHLNRLYTKFFIIRSRTLDDVTVTIGLAGAIVVFVAATIGVIRGPAGKHQWDTSVAEITQSGFLKVAYIEIIVTPFTFLFIKATFLLMYLNIFKVLRWMRIAVYVGLVLLSGFYGAIAILGTYFMSPNSNEDWTDVFTPTNYCKVETISIPSAVLGVAFDIFILILPIVAVSQLKLPTDKKAGAILISATGFLACPGSTFSLYVRIIYRDSEDETWNIIGVVLAIIVEMDVGIICACMPAMSKMLRHHTPADGRLRGWASWLTSLKGNIYGGSRHKLVHSSSYQSDRELSEEISVTFTHPYRSINGQFTPPLARTEVM